MQMTKSERSPQKTAKFRTIDPNVGGWGRVVPNFLSITLFRAYFTIILGKTFNKTSQELRMLSSVAINCQVTNIAMNPGIHGFDKNIGR